MDTNKNRPFELFTKSLPTHPDSAIHDIWCNGDGEIMCSDEDTANKIADLFEAAGYDIMHTSFYDDQRDGLCYGWWAVYPD